MSEYMKRWRQRPIMVGRTFLVIVLLLSGCYAFHLLFGQTLPVDSDSDGIPDSWEIFYDLDPSDPADASSDPDRDGLTNAEEYIDGTDPNKFDTDADGFQDDMDESPISRASLDFRKTAFWSGDEYVYPMPEWVKGVWQEGIEGAGVDAIVGGSHTNYQSASGWHIESSAPEGIGNLSIQLDRSVLSRDVLLALGFFAHGGSSLYVDLLDASFDEVVVDLYGNILGDDSDRVVRKRFEVPLEDYPDASVIRLRRGAGEISVYEAFVYEDTDYDGLDFEQEQQAETSFANFDDDGDGMADGWEVFNSLGPLRNDAGEDPDSDGLTNVQEYEGNTDPQIATSDDGLILHYSLNTYDRKQVFDESGHNNHSFVVGSPLLTDGVCCRAYDFDGAGDYLTRSYDPASGLHPINTPFSVAAWFKTAASLPSQQTIVATHYAGAGYDGYFIVVDSRDQGGRLRSYVGGPDDATVPVSVSPVNDGQWHHFVVVWNVSQTVLYVDAVFQASRGDVGSLSYSYQADFRIGHMENNNAPWALDTQYYFKGSIDEVRVYSRALSAEEVFELFSTCPSTVGTLTLTDKQNPANQREDTMPEDETPGYPENTLFVCQSETGEAEVEIDLSWPPEKGTPEEVGSEYKWKLEQKPKKAENKWTKASNWDKETSGDFSQGPVTVTWTDPGKKKEPVREFRVTAWHDVNNNGEFDEDECEESRLLYVTVLNVEFALSDLWWFEDPYYDHSYFPRIYVTEATGAPDNKGTFRWDVLGSKGFEAVGLFTPGAPGLTESLTLTDNNTVQVQAKGYSDDANDVTLRLTYTTPDGQYTSTTEKTMTVRTFRLLLGTVSHKSYAGGWKTVQNMRITDQFKKDLPAAPTDLGTHEFFGEWEPLYDDENWPPIKQPNGDARIAWRDMVTMPDEIGRIPDPIGPNDIGASTPVDKVTQTWRFGTQDDNNYGAFNMLNGNVELTRNLGYAQHKNE